MVMSQRLLTETVAPIDQIVYQLYGLMEEEIGVAEGEA